MRATLRSLFLGYGKVAYRVRVAAAVIDVAIIAIFLARPYLQLHYSSALPSIDLAIAFVIAGGICVRAFIGRRPLSFLCRATTWVDFVILGTFLLPSAFADISFLRLLSIWSFSRSGVFEDVVTKAGLDRWRNIIHAIVNLITFLFVATGFVFNWFFLPENKSLIEALYFTVATVTTTGFGDITLKGDLGKVASVLMMLIGVSLFLRLAQAITKPERKTILCSGCGLSRHDAHAVHCLACGKLLQFPHDE